MIENRNSFDKEIIALIKKCKNGEDNRESSIPLEDISMWGFSMKLPAGLREMQQGIKKVIFPSNARPPIVRIDENMEYRFIFSRISNKEIIKEGEVSDKVSQTLEGCGKQIVVYEKGVLQAVNTQVEWMDYKMLCLDGGLYGLIYFFDTNTDYIIGGFQCGFASYDKWKPLIIELLKYIQITENREDFIYVDDDKSIGQ